MGMNIANLSLDSVGEKAQGINRVLISIVNQKERWEKEKREARSVRGYLRYKQDGGRYVSFYSSQSRLCSPSVAVICLGLSTKLLEGCKYKHLASNPNSVYILYYLFTDKSNCYIIQQRCARPSSIHYAHQTNTAFHTAAAFCSCLTVALCNSVLIYFSTISGIPVWLWLTGKQVYIQYHIYSIWLVPHSLSNGKKKENKNN